VARRHPEIRRVVARLGALGARYAAMSGSGSAVFGVFSDSATAASAHRALAARGWKCWQTKTLSRAAVLRHRRRVLAGD
jgi:4-diphosphocytidyl-2-C-methyl-D-erythritol kinase